MINLHINTHLAQTIGVEMGCPEVTRPKSFEEAMCCNDSSWLQKVHPPFHRGVCHKKFEVATIRVYASCFCFFWTMCVCVCVWCVDVLYVHWCFYSDFNMWLFNFSFSQSIPWLTSVSKRKPYGDSLAKLKRVEVTFSHIKKLEHDAWSVSVDNLFVGNPDKTMAEYLWDMRYHCIIYDSCLELLRPVYEGHTIWISRWTF